MRQKVYNSTTSEWEYVDSSPVGEEGVVKSSTTAKLTTGPAEPVAPNEGDVWMDTSSSVFPIGTEDIEDGSVTADKIDFETFPIQYGGGVNLTSGLPKTFTPSHDGVMYVTAHSRRNLGTAGDNVITINVTGASDSFAGGAVGHGTADGFAKADWIGAVTKGTPVTISISATNSANPGWKFFVIPGAPQVT